MGLISSFNPFEYFTHCIISFIRDQTCVFSLKINNFYNFYDYSKKTFIKETRLLIREKLNSPLIMSVKFLELRLSNTMDVLIQRPANISSLQAEVSPAVFSHFINFVRSL